GGDVEQRAAVGDGALGLGLGRGDVLLVVGAGVGDLGLRLGLLLRGVGLGPGVGLGGGSRRLVGGDVGQRAAGGGGAVGRGLGRGHVLLVVGAGVGDLGLGLRLLCRRVRRGGSRGLLGDIEERAATGDGRLGLGGGCLRRGLLVEEGAATRLRRRRL